MDDPNITMKEYIRLEEEKARKRGKVFNWEIAKYGKIWYDKDIHDLISVEAEFLAIAFNDGVSSEKTLSYFFKDFENKFPAIVYNDAPTSKLDSLTKSILSPQHIDEFDLKDETSLSEYDEEEQNVLYFNDILPFNIIQPNDLKSEKDNDDNEIDIIQSSGDMALPPRDQRHQYLRYEGLQYSDVDIADFEERLERIHDRDARMLMKYRDNGGVIVFTSRAWRRLFDTKGPLVRELILEFYSTLRFGEGLLDLDSPRLDVGSVNIPYLLARYLRRFAAGRKSGALISRAQFVAQLAEHFRLLTEERHWGLTVIMRELPVIDMAELVRLQIYMEIDDTWEWVALGPERQPDAAAGAPEAAEDAPIADEGDQAVPATVQAPQQPPPPPPATGLVQRSMTDQGIFSTWMISCMTQLMEASGQTYQAFDGTFQGSSPAAFQRCTRQRTDGASTSTA
ncbi:hypothetical protein Tco_1056071 [Tanacetum coccineum]|uniref:Uncharacterized protein n=1 Tax=Tanacetum coccineum TaxID=301880 RepID=A0ABQ5H1Q0_9ASTR